MIIFMPLVVLSLISKQLICLSDKTKFMKVGIIVSYCDELAVLVFVLVLVFGGESLVPNAILGEGQA